MRKSILTLCALLTVCAVSASLLGKPKIVQCDDSELAKVTGGWFTECDGNTPCEVWCHPGHTLSWFEYNNGAQTCGSPALENCQNDLKADCQRRFFWDTQCLSWNGQPDAYYDREVCSGRTIGPVPYPNP